MQVEEIRNIAVVGAGLMGHGIAQECALYGYSVALTDVRPQAVDQALANIEANLQTLVASGMLTTERADTVLPQIHACPQLGEALAEADFVIEAAAEDLGIKQSLFREMDALCPARTILASNTSTFMPTRLASATRRPDKVLITHYFNPPYLLPLIEVVCGEATSEETLHTALALLTRMGKRPVQVRKEVPGFIGNRLQIALLREALSLVEQGVATPQDVDAVIKNGFGRRLAAAGVFEVFDFGGWNLILAILQMLLPEIESSTEASPLLVEKVARGELGVKSGQGFYNWDTVSAQARKAQIAQALVALTQLPSEKE